MGSKRPDRRAFLKGGAALAGGLTLGAVSTRDRPDASIRASGAMIKGSKELIAYGDRSRFVTSVRIAHPSAAGLRPMPSGSCFMWRPRFRIRWG